VLSSGRHVIMDINVRGRSSSRGVPASVLIFVLPPSAQVLVDRSQGPGHRGHQSLIRRFESAKAELKSETLYQYIIVTTRSPGRRGGLEYHRCGRIQALRDGELDERVRELLDGIQRAIGQYSAEEVNAGIHSERSRSARDQQDLAFWSRPSTRVSSTNSRAIARAGEKKLTTRATRGAHRR